jgi:hypothetical protein
MKKAASLQAGGGACCQFHTSLLLGLLFNSEKGGDMFLVYTEDQGI